MSALNPHPNHNVAHPGVTRPMPRLNDLLNPIPAPASPVAPHPNPYTASTQQVGSARPVDRYHRHYIRPQQPSSVTRAEVGQRSDFQLDDTHHHGNLQFQPQQYQPNRFYCTEFSCGASFGFRGEVLYRLLMRAPILTRLSSCRHIKAPLTIDHRSFALKRAASGRNKLTVPRTGHSRETIMFVFVIPCIKL